MAIFTEKEIDKGIGKNKLFAPRTSINYTHYIGGFESLDGAIDKSHFLAQNMPTNIHLHPLGVEISVMCKFKLHKLGLSYNDIVSVHIESKEAIKESKEKSVIGRALLGGLFFGLAGAVVGALTGLGTKEIIISSPDYVMTIIYTENDNKKAAIFSCNANKGSTLIKDAKAVFGSKYLLNNV